MRLALRLGAFCALAALVLAFGPARGEVGEVRVAQQFGISYLSFHVIKSERLFEDEAKKAGIPGTRLAWSQFAAGNAMNEALISGSLDIASGGVGPLITLWSKTKGRQDAKAIASLTSMPNVLVTTNPAVRTLKDFTDKDRIALPAVKVSFQAVTLQIAAEQQFGEGQSGRLDPLTVSMSHPDAAAALLSGGSEVSAHFTSAPFYYRELEDKRVHQVLTSYDVLGGPGTFNLLWTTRAFHDQNPKAYGALLAALERGNAFIRENPRRAAEIYQKEESSKLPLEFIEKILADPANVFTTQPQQIMKYAAFMHKTGAIEQRPASWQDLFFPEIHGGGGS
jgi:NitT/TauT family transport system substrate-binding protein